MKGRILQRILNEIIVVGLVFVLTVLSSGYRSHDKKKSHKYDSSKSRMRKKTGGREKEAGGGTRRAGSRVTSQRPLRSHSDDEEDEGVPASYHTVSLQVSQDVSTTALLPPLPDTGVSEASQNPLDSLHQLWEWPPELSDMLWVVCLRHRGSCWGLRPASAGRTLSAGLTGVCARDTCTTDREISDTYSSLWLHRYFLYFCIY